MAVNEVNQEPNTTVPQVESNLKQQNIDTTLAQNNAENPQQKQPEQESHEDPNWKAFREARKRDRAEKEEAQRKAAEKEAEVAALKAAMESAFSKSAPTPQAYQQYYGMNQDQEHNEETEEQRIEKKVNELLSKKEQEYLRKQQEREQQEYPNRLSKDFPDFRYVCSQENLDYLDYHYPELSRPLQRLPEGYDKWSDIYHAVKKFIPNHANVKKDAIKADINSNKPKSMASGMVTPPGEKTRESWQESEQRRAENWARMQRIMKGVG